MFDFGLFKNQTCMRCGKEFSSRFDKPHCLKCEEEDDAARIRADRCDRQEIEQMNTGEHDE